MSSNTIQRIWHPQLTPVSGGVLNWLESGKMTHRSTMNRLNFPPSRLDHRSVARKDRNRLPLILLTRLTPSRTSTLLNTLLRLRLGSSKTLLMSLLSHLHKRLITTKELGFTLEHASGASSYRAGTMGQRYIILIVFNLSSAFTVTLLPGSAASTHPKKL